MAIKRKIYIYLHKPLDKKNTNTNLGFSNDLACAATLGSSAAHLVAVIPSPSPGGRFSPGRIDHPYISMGHWNA